MVMKKAAAKKSPAKKTAAKKTAAKKAPAKKTAAKKTTAKKTAAKKAPAKKTAAKKAPAKKTTARKTTAKKTRPRRRPRRRPCQEGAGQEDRQEGRRPLTKRLSPGPDLESVKMVAWTPSATTSQPNTTRSTESSPTPISTVATPAAGWTVADQLSHLWFFDQRALLALTDPDGVRR